MCVLNVDVFPLILEYLFLGGGANASEVSSSSFSIFHALIPLILPSLLHVASKVGESSIRYLDISVSETGFCFSLTG